MRPEVAGGLTGLGAAAVFLGTVFLLSWLAYRNGQRDVCSADNFPVGSVHRMIAECKASGGYPDITYQGLLQCRKSTSVPLQ